MTVQASIIVDFGALEEGGHLSAELDSEKNSSKTTFLQGDAVYFRVYASCEYDIRLTSGSAVKEDTVISDTIHETASFILSSSFATGKLIKDGTLDAAPVWYGNNLGDIKKTGHTQIALVNDIDDPLGICKISYNTEYDLWKLTPPASMPSEYAILILISAT